MAKKKIEEKGYLSLAGLSVGHVRKVSEKIITFTLAGKGVALYNMRMIEGARGTFIAPPAHKGNDGKWYDDYAVYFSPEDQKRIAEAVVAQLGVGE